MEAEREGTVMLIKAIIGGAALVFPRCFQRAGIIPSSVALLVAGWAGVKVGDLLMETRRALGPKVSSIRDMAISVTGSQWGGVFMDATVTLQSFGTLVGYVVACGDLVYSLLRKGFNMPDRIMLHDLHEAFGVNASVGLRSFSLIMLTAFVFFPLCLLRRLESMRSLAASTLVIYATFLLVLLREAASRVLIGDFNLAIFGADGTDHLLPSAPLNWMDGGLHGMMRVLPIIALSYSCVPLMMEVRRTLERKIPSPQKMDAAWHNVSVVAFAASGFFYLATGFLGYVAFRGSTHANVLSNLESLGAIAMIVNALFAASLIVSYPLICFVVREPVRRVLLSIWTIFSFSNADGGGGGAQGEGGDDVEEYAKHHHYGNSEFGNNNNNGGAAASQQVGNMEDPSFILFAMEAMVVTGCTLAAAIAVPGIDVVLELIGGTAAVMVSYIAPVGFFLAVRPRTYSRDWFKAAIIGIVGTLIGVLTCWNLYRSMHPLPPTVTTATIAAATAEGASGVAA